MEKILIVVERRDGHPLKVALELAAAARQFAPVVEAVIWGGDGESAAEELGAHGVTRVYLVGDLGDSLAGPSVARAIAELLRSGEHPDAVFFGSTYNGRDIAARLSVLLDLPLITNVVGLEAIGGELVSSHAVFGGEGTVTAKFTTEGPGIFVIRSKSFEAAPMGGPPAEMANLAVPELGGTDAAKIVKRHVDTRSGPSLEDAAIVVSGGRGLGGAENFELIEELARLLKGAPGASRAAVDAGWVPYSYQVGQTGKTVKPDVYLAFGISGAIQHRVGMKGATHIVAVDKDPSASIFQLADLGVVGDALEVLPKLIQALKAREVGSSQ
jgi:electron transfer flavoprotein alpha subunit